MFQVRSAFANLVKLCLRDSICQWDEAIASGVLFFLRMHDGESEVFVQAMP
jgi:hypothetical protein